MPRRAQPYILEGYTGKATALHIKNPDVDALARRRGTTLLCKGDDVALTDIEPA